MPAAEPALAPRHALALGLLQGPAELLPISSSAHTALVPWLAGWPYGELDDAARKDFEVLLHAGAGLALALRLAGECAAARRTPSRLGFLLAGIAPAALAGAAFERSVERRLGGPLTIAAGLAGGAVAMAIADRATPGRDSERAAAGWHDGLALGLAQAAALAPGVSRNGATLAAARARGFSRRRSHALSWEVGLPVILGPVLLRGARRSRSPGARPGALAAGLGTAGAFVSAWLTATPRVRRRLSRLPLLPFAVYRIALAAVVLAVRRRRAK